MASDGPYKYDPSTTAAVLFAIIFCIPTIWHCIQCVRTRSWYFIALIIGGFFEIIGYTTRAITTKDVDNKAAYIIQTLTILLAPALFAASMYMLLGRLVVVTRSQRLSLIRPNWLTKIFVGGDVLSFLIQCLGGGVLATQATADKPDQSKLDLGENIIVVGLFVQLVFFGLFLIVGGWWARRLRRESSGKNDGSGGVPWKKHFVVLMAASFLVFVRSAFRVIEYLGGSDGYLLSHEWPAYVFDAALMYTVMVLFNTTHPSEVTRFLKMPEGQIEIGLVRG
ncbi:putative rta1 domain protein [Botryosphaeria dothidea]|uniref:Rta1 domain protein n=1 Tax=Botryosphaeria dothidea TaxID=55169 RepID=A0A8H4J1I9_9PEZI|nr:putative rta1 domain protein [Botryosphaeria dothidea]